MMQERPNILLLFCDQFRWDCVSALGNRELITPNLDRLHREGTSFTRAYTPSPVCVPARNAKFWGMYPCRTGVSDNDRTFAPFSDNIMELLGKNGYYRHGIGKMHFAVDPDGLNGFSSRERQEELACGPDTDEYLRYLINKGYDRVFDVHGQRSEMYYIPQISQLPQQDHPTNWVGDRAVAFVRDYDRKEPFFLMTSFVHPHPPFSPPASWNKCYRLPEVSYPFVPEDYDELLVYINHFQNRYKYRSNGIDRNLIRTMRAFYFSCVSFVDYQIGRIVDELKRQGILDKTLIVFTSDHGEMLGDYNSFGKRCMLDPSARIPMIARLPSRFKPDTRCDIPVSLVDLLPTFLEAAGIRSDNILTDGVDLALTAKGESDREYVFSQFNDKGYGLYMVASRYEKYIYSASDGKSLYFDSRVDETESRNLEYLPERQDDALRMRKVLLDFLSANVPDAVEESDFKEYPSLQVPEDQDAFLFYQDQTWCREVEKQMPDGYPVKLY